MSVWSKLFGFDDAVDLSSIPGDEFVNEERPVTNPQEAALDSLRQNGWNVEDWVEALGDGDDGNCLDWMDRAINASTKYHDENG